MIPDLSISTLLTAYREGTCSPGEIIPEAWKRASSDDPAIWISRPTESQLRASLRALEGESPDTKPLYGIPFAIKDNIDCAGYPTTAACPSWSYAPARHAFVVKLLIDAGAIPMGKTNLDQFATGLVGVRSPYGVPGNAFNADYIPGGSSSGSAVAVAKGLCSFSLGTDTAGSGRVPASFNNLIGLKATRGLLSCTGVVPACRTLDCVSIFALTAADASCVLQAAAAFDASDAYARKAASGSEISWPPKIGVPGMDQLDFFGNDDAKQLFVDARQTIASMGWKTIEVDISAFLDAAQLLYEGPWVAERTSVVSQLPAGQPEAHPPCEDLDPGRGTSVRRTPDGWHRGGARQHWRHQAHRRGDQDRPRRGRRPCASHDSRDERHAGFRGTHGRQTARVQARSQGRRSRPRAQPRCGRRAVGRGFPRNRVLRHTLHDGADPQSRGAWPRTREARCLRTSHARL